MAAAPLEKPCYFEGKIRPLREANINIQTHALQYGTAIFGGIRGYWNEEKKNIYIFRLNDHWRRLVNSAKMMQMKFPFTYEEFLATTRQMLQEGEWKQNVYLRPFVYKSDLELSPRLHNVGDQFAMYALPLDDYLDTKRGQQVCVSSWVRLHESQIPARAKANGGYVNSALAKSEALENGFDEAIFLDISGNVSEGTAANLFLIKDGVLITPDLSSSILEGITRRSILELAKDLGIETSERRVSRSELYTADELFFAGTGVQVAWIQEVDRRPIGFDEVKDGDFKIGPLTEKLQTAFFKIVRGEDDAYKKWLTPIY